MAGRESVARRPSPAEPRGPACLHVQSAVMTVSPHGRQGTLADLLLLALFTATVWFGLGMHRGLLLSIDIKSLAYPWAGVQREHGSQTPVLADPVHQFVPWLELARRELLAGRLPLWNPHQDGGVPLLGNAQSALLSPLVWPVLALGIEGGWNLSLLARLALAAAGTFLWLREAGRSRGGATLGALAFAVSGPFIAWLAHPHTLTAAGIPLLLWRVERGARSGSFRDGAAIAGATALVLAGGHPETALMGALLAGARLLTLTTSWRVLGRVVVGVGAGIGAVAPMLLPFAEYLGQSEALQGVGRHPFAIEPGALLRFLLPRASLGHPIEAAATVSVTVLLLVVIGGLGAWREPEARFWGGATLVILVLVYDNPVARWVAHGTGIYWTRLLLILPLGLAWLGARGLDLVMDRLAARRRPWLRDAFALLATGATLAELVHAGRGVHGVTDPALLHLSSPLIARLHADPEAFRVLPLGTFLAPNFATTEGIDDVRGYDAIIPAGWRRERERIGHFHNDMMRAESLTPGGAALNGWNVKYILAPPGSSTAVAELNGRLGLDLAEVYNGADGRIWRNRRALPRARLTGTGDAEVVRSEPTLWLVRTTAPATTSLVLANPYFPGWRARLDGHDVSLAARPGQMIEVAVPAGRHLVEIAYRPRSFALGLALAGLAVLTIGALCAGGRSHRRTTVSMSTPR
jgi:hypothetical protein